MKRTISLLLVAAFALCSSGCVTYVGQLQTPLAETSPASEEQTFSATGLGARIPVGTAVPKVVATVTGATVLSNSKGAVDVSNSAEGYILARYTGGKKVKIILQIYLTEDNKYNYNLNADGKAEAFPLSEGDGKYTVKILENTTGNKYAVAYSCTVEAKLRNPLLPFLYSNKYINYAAAPKTVEKAAELTKNAKTDLEKVEAIYTFVIGVTYDKAFAAKVASGEITGHVPVLDTTLATKKGICFDYAALMAGMLRSQGVPVRMVHGYAATTYHAWLNVFIQGVGWIDKVIYFDGENWTMMDPTFVSSSKNADAINKFIGDGKSYTAKQCF